MQGAHLAIALPHSMHDCTVARAMMQHLTVAKGTGNHSTAWPRLLGRTCAFFRLALAPLFFFVRLFTSSRSQ